MKIKTKFMLTVATIMLVGTFLVMAWNYYFLYTQALREASHTNAILSESIHEAVYGFMMTGQQEFLDAYLRKTRTFPSVHEVSVIRSASLEKEIGVKDATHVKDDLEQQVLRTGQAVDRKVNVGRARAIRIVSPVIADKMCLTCHASIKEGEVVAAVNTISVFQSSLDAMTKNLIRTGLIQFAGIILVLGAIFILFHSLIMNPVAQLGVFVGKLGKGDWTASIDLKSLDKRKAMASDQSPVRINAQDEIGELAVAFNQMSRNLQKTTVSRDQLLKEIEARKDAEMQLKEAYAFNEATINHLLDIFYVFDAKGKFLRWNNRLNEVTGYSNEEIALMKALDFFSEEEQPRVVKAIETVWREGYAIVEADMITKTGKRILYELNGALLKDSRGNTIGLTGFGRDITERKRAERDLQEANAQKEAVFNAASEVSMIATDPKGVIKVFNPGAEKMLGYRAEEIVDKETPAIIHLAQEVEARGKELTQLFNKPIEGFDVFVEMARREGSEKREWTYRRKDGSHIIVDLVVTAVRDSTGAITGFLGIAQDITERKQAEEEVLTHTHEMEVFYEASIGREERILELKQEIEDLKKELGRS